MKCAICKYGETTAGEVTVTLERGATVVIIKGAPAQVCGNCGEYYLDELAEKCNEGRLTAAEHEQYEAYVEAIGFVAILQAKARKIWVDASAA